ncbi:transglycosylase domain-containing protein [Streptomyces sp. NPDC003860]
MSEHRRKPPQPQSGGRAAARRAAQQPSGRRAAPSHGSEPAAHGEERPYGGRAEARRAAQRGGRRRVDGTADGGRGGRGGGRRGAGAGGHQEPGRGGRPGKKRLIDYPRQHKDGWRRWVPSWKLVSGLALAFLGTLMGAATLAYAMVGIPDPDKMAEAENNVYYWDDGTPMAATGGEVNRQNVDISEIPKHMQKAVISAENKTFETDSGIDPKGISRALVNMAKGEQTQGGSTITQQYVKNAVLADQSQTLSRKVKELFISIKVGANEEKSDIMAGYLNTSYYGRGAYGIQAAARTYLGKNAIDINESEAAFLTTLLKGATYYDPAGSVDIDAAATPEANLKRVTKRWAWVLDEMVKDGHLTKEKRATFTALPEIQPVTKGAKLGGQIGYLVDLAKANFVSNNKRGITADDLALGGYEIHTTFNKKKIQQLEAAVKKAYEKNIDPKKRPKTDTHVQFGGASVDVESGKIVAIYGGADATKHFTNNANNTGAQVGSTFKPYVLAAAMRDGVRDPSKPPNQPDSDRTRVDPDKGGYSGKNKLVIKNYDGSTWRNEKGEEWRQVNDGDQPYGEMTMREAMIESANSPFVQIGMDIGIPKVREAAIDSGLLEESLNKADVPSFSIGISTPSAIRMASSYATFAAQGEQREPYSVQSVKKKGRVIYEHKDDPERAFDPAVANNVTDVLKDVVTEGTGKNAQVKGHEIAGKTGTTDGNKSAWFVGYTPKLATAIDMYRLDDDETKKNRAFLEMFGTGGQDKIHGSSFPSDIFADYMGDALKGQKSLKFPKPEPIGEAVWGGGASSPPPSPSTTPSKKESEKPSSTPSKETSSSGPSKPATSASQSCDPWDNWNCNGNGNNGNDNNGNDNGGPGGKPSGSQSSSASTGIIAGREGWE